MHKENLTISNRFMVSNAVVRAYDFIEFSPRNSLPSVNIEDVLLYNKGSDPILGLIFLFMKWLRVWIIEQEGGI